MTLDDKLLPVMDACDIPHFNLVELRSGKQSMENISIMFGAIFCLLNYDFQTFHACARLILTSGCIDIR